MEERDKLEVLKGIPDKISKIQERLKICLASPDELRLKELLLVESNAKVMCEAASKAVSDYRNGTLEKTDSIPATDTQDTGLSLVS